MLDPFASDLDAVLLRAVSDRKPDIVVLCGWVFWPYTRLVHAPALGHARKLLGMDTPWRGTVVQRLARFRLSHFVDGLDLVVTAGERSAEYARGIGVPERRLPSGYYGLDSCSDEKRSADRPAGWPRQFLYDGRYAPEKDLATLVRAYELYRLRVDDRWGLTCRGSGPDAPLLNSVLGIV